MSDLFPAIRGEADISPCGRYRWTLRRIWDDALPGVLWIMLNPSVASADVDDPTIRRVISFSQSWGYGSATVVNLYPFRSSKPDECRRWADWEKNGPDWYARDRLSDNLSVIEAECRRSPGMVLAAWGAGAWDDMWTDHVVENSIECVPDIALHCLGTTKDGSPKHPLYVRGDQKPILWQSSGR